MAEFMLLFRRDITAEELSAEQMQEIGKKWWAWRSDLEAKNKVAASGNRLSKVGRVVRENSIVTDGPYAEIKEGLGGFMIIIVNDFDEAVFIAQSCPILLQRGNVEVRKFIAPDDNES